MTSNGKRVLVTGSAGFIGFHTCSKLLQQGATVLGVDNFSAYYDVALKEARTDILGNHAEFSLARVSIEDNDAFAAAWTAFEPDTVIHLAAQAGVRYSIDEPRSYIGANIVGTHNVLELARHNPVRHLLAASTSSVYGANTEMPFEETQRTQTPLSLYAATKGATELMGHSYSHLFGTPMTFFRFFTVYGPWAAVVVSASAATNDDADTADSAAYLMSFIAVSLHELSKRFWDTHTSYPRTATDSGEHLAGATESSGRESSSFGRFKPMSSTES